MEEFIQILIFVGAMVIAVVGQSAKNKKKPVMPSSGEVLEDIFPDIEATQEPMDMPSPQPIRPEVKAPKRTSRQSKPAPRQVIPSTPPPASPKPTQKIRISTREEARRAFIHSEIFNRKY
jgi:hypothetical protein